MGDLRTVAQGSDVLFLVQRVGWFFACRAMAMGGITVSHYILRRLSANATNTWSSPATLAVVFALLRTLLGLALVARRPAALLPLALLLPAQGIITKVALRLFFPPILSTEVLFSSIYPITTSILLLWLYFKTRTRSSTGVSPST
jgi:hypothetical protein